eukprot:CAMPEP_0180797492 /NCGR_PEP_ID=MMETSP1038_2-20121128/57400_1 /TAXON_ID=632150 /ORGANISM="Azadinium spinosum, Strain 3D9" /LENGTH=153 /DNA_ID=CAMNT_0022836759 /DNA_START=23 /DNA_END=481 /DNA_ORIENTATION=-
MTLGAIKPEPAPSPFPSKLESLHEALNVGTVPARKELAAAAEDEESWRDLHTEFRCTERAGSDGSVPHQLHEADVRVTLGQAVKLAVKAAARLAEGEGDLQKDDVAEALRWALLQNALPSGRARDHHDTGLIDVLSPPLDELIEGDDTVVRLV